MEGLGNHFNVAPIASGAAINYKNIGGCTFVCTGNDTFTITGSATFGGTYNSTGLSIIVRKFTNTSTDGTAAWVKATQAAGAAVTISSGSVAFYVDADSLPDGINFVKCTRGSAGLVTAIVNELDVKRSPDNLAAMSA